MPRHIIEAWVYTSYEAISYLLLSDSKFLLFEANWEMITTHNKTASSSKDANEAVKIQEIHFKETYLWYHVSNKACDDFLATDAWKNNLPYTKYTKNIWVLIAL